MRMFRLLGRYSFVTTFFYPCFVKVFKLKTVDYARIGRALYDKFRLNTIW